ncbi:MAG: aldo/keto reductase [Phycisphaerae bacterium]|nr:aldo/keto reductase [Planctomycetota bacterium]MBL7219004.1 aldo/keto reductase [Phycisphaerae bacterium]
MADKGINRREFIRNSAVAAGAVAAGLGGNFVASAADTADVKKTRSYNPDMDYRRLGATGLWVSSVCLGGHWKRVNVVTGRKGIPSYAPGKNAEDNKVLRQNRYDVLTRCMERGINYVDACTKGEISVYGPALKGRRDKMYMGFAMWPECPRNKKYRTATQLLKTLEEGLKLAQVEYVDVWRLVADSGKGHGEADELEFIKAFETAKKQGKARFTGVSSHSRKWLKHLVETYPKHYQVVLFPYTVQTKELPKDSLFEAIRKQDIGSFGIKPFASNSLFKKIDRDKTKSASAKAEAKAAIARLTIRYILGNPALTAPIPGLACVEEVDNMALAIKEHRKALTAKETTEIERIGAETFANLPPEYKWLKNWEYV